MPPKSTHTSSDSADLTVLKVRDDTEQDHRFDDLDPRLMKPPFRTLINAPSGSGKSVLNQNFIWNDNFYKDLFDAIIYLSPTIYEDKTAQHMHKMEDSKLIISDEVEELDTLISNLMERQSEEEHKDDHILLILDDCIGLIKRGSKLNTAIMRLRHYRVSVIMVTQYYRGVDPKVRENCSSFIFFKNANMSEVKKIVDEVGGGYDNFKKYYKYATSEPYCFLYVNGRRLYKNFDELLYDGIAKYSKDV
jgi:hypothetical protein